MEILCKWFATKAKSFASDQKPLASGLQVKKILCKWFASKAKSFPSGQKSFANGLKVKKNFASGSPVKKTLPNLFASGSQVVYKPFSSGLLASKPMQIQI